MRSMLRLLLCLPLFALLAACAGHAPSERLPLRVMSFNVRYSEGQDDLNAWPNRRDLAVKTILDRRPALLGTQELLLPQAEYFAAHLDGYVWFGRGRNGNELDVNDNEHMGVFYDTHRLKLLDSGDFWLSETPEVPGSSNFGQSMPRMVTWGYFQDRRSGKRFHYFNTHFPHMAEAEPIRERCAALIRSRFEQLPADEPFILTGDFNTTPDLAAHAYLATTLQDAREQAPVKIGPDNTFHDFGKPPSKRIDWILYRGLGISRVETVTDHAGAVYPSDHYPVVADFVL